MAETTERRTRPWAAFLAGALVMLVLAMLWGLWASRRAASEAVRTAAAAADVVPDVPRPRLPDAPRIPDAPLPTPR